MLSQNGLTRYRLRLALVVRHVAQWRSRCRRGGFFDELEEFEIVGQLLVSQVGEGQLFKAGYDGRALLVDCTPAEYCAQRERHRPAGWQHAAG